MTNNVDRFQGIVFSSSRIVWFACLFIYLIANNGYGQNLINNGGFEDYSSLPKLTGQWSLCRGWLNPSVGNNGKVSTPDYFHLKGQNKAKLPYASYAKVYPHRGEAVIGLVTKSPGINFREYLSNKLSSPMKSGITYIVSFYITNGEANFSYGLSSNNIGVHFSTFELKQVDRNVPIDVIPQINIKEEVWSKTWKKYTFYFEADKDYKYFTIGNFYADSKTSSSRRASFGADWSYYFIDDIEIVIDSLMILGDSSLCSGDTAILHATKGSAFRWVDSENPGITLSTQQRIAVSPRKSTTYILYSDDDSILHHVDVLRIPKPLSSFKDTLCKGEDLLLYLDVPQAKYSWNNQSVNSFLNVDKAGHYWVDIEVDNCIVRDSISITVDDCACDFKISNVFTPNADDVNDEFFLPLECYPLRYELSVYDRIGNQLFKTTDYKNGWNGEVNGQAVSEGIYFYVLAYRGTDKISREVTGNITLFR